jgi:hypothetical protein
MAALTSQTILCGFERLSPAGSAVEAVISQSRRHIICHIVTRAYHKRLGEMTENETNFLNHIAMKKFFILGCIFEIKFNN